MANETRIYIVDQLVGENLETSLVQAKNRQQAVAFVARNSITARIARQSELLGRKAEEVQDATALTENMAEQRQLDVAA